jgi:5'-nucleotidase
MRILVTNDDGIDSLGLHVLAQAMAAHGEVVVVAPNAEYSGAGAALGALQKIRPEVRRVDLPDLEPGWSVTGPPALCVTFARLGAFGPPFDLVVAGINPGANVGRSVYHSGTVGAALTARNGGTNALAVSQEAAGGGVEGQGSDDGLDAQRWDTAATVAGVAVGALVAAPPEHRVALNLNVPNLALADLEGWRWAEVGRSPARALSSAALTPRPGHPGTYDVAMAWGEKLALPPGTDGAAVEAGLVSLSVLGRLDDPGEVSHQGVSGVVAALDGLLPG